MKEVDCLYPRFTPELDKNFGAPFDFDFFKTVKCCVAEMATPTSTIYSTHLHLPPASVYLLPLLLLHRPLVLAPAKANLRQVFNHEGFRPTGWLSTRTQVDRVLTTFSSSCTIASPTYEFLLNLTKAKQ